MKHAILAAGAVMAGLMVAAGPLDPPLKVHFKLVDGVQFRGEMTAWDADGFDGTFGRRLWTDLIADDIWRLYLRVMDQNASGDWINLGRVLLLASPPPGPPTNSPTNLPADAPSNSAPNSSSHTQKKAGDLAERAFSRALRIDASAGEAIEKVRAEVAEVARARAEAKRLAEAAKLETSSPEARDWPADPWPGLGVEEQAAATAQMRADAQRIAHQVAGQGVNLALLETDHFLMYTDCERREAAEWVLLLEKVYRNLRQMLGVGIAARANEESGGAAIATEPWGKVVVFVFTERDRFRLVEAEVFKQLVPLSMIAICHPVGPRVFVAAHRECEPEAFQWALVREVVHGLMHRYRSPKRLPAWANEGIADYLAAQTLRGRVYEEDFREQGLRFIRGMDGAAPGNVAGLLDLKYADESWPGAEGGAGGAGKALDIARSVGALVVELMLRERPGGFAGWVRAVKDGVEWEQALAKEFGAGKAQLAETVAAYYKVND